MLGGLAGVRASVRFPLEAPYPVEPVLRWLRAHAVPGAEGTDSALARHRVAMHAPSGPAVVEVDLSDARTPTVTLDLADGSDAPAVEAGVRAWLDVDAPTELIDAHLGGTSALAPLVSARPGLRALGALDPFECAVRTILGQHVSVSAARTFGGRLVAAFGSQAPSGLCCFPTAAALAEVDPGHLQRAIGVTHARARTLAALCLAFADAPSRLGTGADPRQARADLLALPGIGPWTADYLSLRVWRDPDAFPADDLVIRRALGVRRAAQARAIADQWRPYRAYAVIHLWAAAASDPARTVGGHP